VANIAPTQTFIASDRYMLPLDAGNHLVCTGGDCINVTVRLDKTSTVNIRVIDGPASFYVDDTASGRIVKAASFGVSP
jgi:hypothetical protein